MTVTRDDDQENGVKTGVCTLTLDAPDRLNALSEEMGESLVLHAKELSQDAEIRAVVLTGRGRAFSAGGDLAFLAARAADTPAANSERMRAFYRRFLSIRDIGVPVIAAVNGAAIGAGACLAMACDLRVVASEAPIGFTFVGLGLHPGMAGTFTLPRVAGRELATSLLLTGEPITGREAVERGLALEHAPPEGVLSRARAIARTIARRAPLAVRHTLATLRAAEDEGLDRALQREADAQAQSYATEDLREGIAALREKRPPAFTGR